MKKIAIAVSTIVLLTACSASIDDLVAYTQQIKANTQVSIEPYSKFETTESANYAALDIRSPFMRARGEPPVAQVEATPNCSQPDRNRSREVLERYGLDALEMSGVLSISGKRFALIKANDGTLHRAAVGNYVGLFHGKVTQIGSNEVKIREMLPDGAGCWQPKTATISMASATGDNS